MPNNLTSAYVSMNGGLSSADDSSSSRFERLPVWGGAVVGSKDMTSCSESTKNEEKKWNEKWVPTVVVQDGQ